jgi:hypothetical protein
VRSTLILGVVAAILFPAFPAAATEVVEIASVRELADYAAKSGHTVRMKPGVYRMSDHLTDAVIDEIRTDVAAAAAPGRPPVWMIRFAGSDNRFDMRDVVLEIETDLYRKLPRGYTRCLFVPGHNNAIDGLTIRNTGSNRGSGGNILSIFGNGNRLENVTLHVYGSKPYGYGDLLGKGGPNLVGLEKQSGIMIAGRDNTIRRCKVISRAFGHCFYIQEPSGITTDNIRLEDCYAEGVVRTTADMLRETSGPLLDLNFATIAENRDGRFLVVPGYVKSLVEDGFRTYSGAGRVTLLNCTAVNTRAGFEISGADDGQEKTLIDGGTALGCERAYLIGGNTVVRSSRGDTRHGPLLYLRGGKDADVDLELTGGGSDYTVHALATIAGEGHRVRLFTEERERVAPALPIMLGFGMPSHAEMASPIRPAAAKNVHLINELPRCVVIQGPEAVDCTVRSAGRVLTDEQTRALPKPPATTPASRLPKAR